MKREFFGGGGRPGISSVMVDAFNIMQDRITRARLAGDPPDLLISPRVGKIGWFDFHRADELIVHGAKAAERAIEFDPGGDPHSGTADGERRRAAAGRKGREGMTIRPS